MKFWTFLDITGVILYRAIMARKNKAIILQKIRDIGFNMLISHIKFGKHNFKNKVSFFKGKLPEGFL